MLVMCTPELSNVTMEFILFYLPLTVFSLSLVTCIVAFFKNRNRIAHIAECVMWWMTISFVMPFRAIKYRLVNKSLYAWLLALLSPAAIVTYYIVYSIATLNSPLPYDKLNITTRDGIEGIMNLSDFPEYEYESNTHDGWTGETVVKYTFKDSVDVERLFTELEEMLCTEDSVYLSRITNEDPEFCEHWGSNEVYVFRRGWYGYYIKRPRGVNQDDEGIVNIVIGKKRLTIRYDSCYLFNIEAYATPDSLEKTTGVLFPDYEFIDCDYYDMFVDHAWEGTIRLKEKPSKQFVNSLKNAEHWKAKENGTYEFNFSDRNSDMSEIITVDPKSQYVKVSISTY